MGGWGRGGWPSEGGRLRGGTAKSAIDDSYRLCEV